MIINMEMLQVPNKISLQKIGVLTIFSRTNLNTRLLTGG